MLVKFFRHGTVKKGKSSRTGGGNAVKNYLLGKDGKRENAKVVRGNAEQTTEIINGIKNKSIYKSGVLSFSKDEQPSDKDLEKIMDSFENTLFPNMEKDQYSGYWVKHTDKDRTELHFVFAEIELTTGKALPVYYAQNDLSLVDSWKDMVNHEFNLADPNAPKNKRSLTPSKDFELKDGYKSDDKISDEQQKERIHERIFGYINFFDEVNSRDDVVKVIEELGYEVTRQSKKDSSISIKNPQGGRNLKLKGDIYAPDFDRSKLPKEQSYAQQDYDRNKNQRYEKAKQIYADSLQRRINRMNKRFGTIDRTPLDNQLTKDLAKIRLDNEPRFLEKIQNEREQRKQQLALEHQKRLEKQRQEKEQQPSPKPILETPKPIAVDTANKSMPKATVEQPKSTPQPRTANESRRVDTNTTPSTPKPSEPPKTTPQNEPSKMQAKKQRYEDRKLAIKQIGEKFTKNIDNVKSGINETFNTIKSGIDILTVSIHAEVVNEQQAERERQEKQKEEQQRKELERLKKLDRLSPKEIIDECNNKIETIANDILRNQLQALRTKAKPILATFEKLRDNEPLLGKDKWKHDKQQALDAYNAIKEKHDTMKDNGITDEHRKQALEQLVKDDPVIHERMEQAIIQVLRDEAKKHGVDSYADDGRPYRGKIIKSDDKMSLQQTDKGIVYHYIGGLEVGKDYTLTSYGDKYRVQKHESLEQQRRQQEQQQSQEKIRQYGKNDDKGR